MGEEIEAVLVLARGSRLDAQPFNAGPLRSLLDAARGMTWEARGELARALCAGLEVDEDFNAAAIAMTCGTLVEWGADPQAAGAAVVARLEAAVGVAAPDPVAVRWLVFAAMAHLCRDEGLRVATRGRPGLYQALEGVEERVSEVGFVRTVLELVDGVELLVLAPEQGRGYRVRIEAVRMNFHLFTLLQGTLIGDPEAGWLEGAPVDEEVLAVARGEAALTRRLYDEQRFHFHNWSALDEAGGVRRDLRSTIWGEGSPLDIPLVEGERVVVLGSTVLGGRSWDANLFASIHDALRSRVEVKARLSSDEVGAAVARIIPHVRALEG